MVGDQGTGLFDLKLDGANILLSLPDPLFGILGLIQCVLMLVFSLCNTGLQLGNPLSERPFLGL